MTAARRRIALLGFGTVGSALARRLTTDDSPAPLVLTQIFDRRAAQKRASLGAPGVAWTSSIDDVLRGDADVVVEAIGGVEPAAAWIRAALTAGKSVVTANKQVVARYGIELSALAARRGCHLRYEAAVGGAMPIVRAIADSLAGDRITHIEAILNGTSNAVLSRMEATGCCFEDAVDDARARGYAEADPSDDLDGRDAQAKLAILCALAFGVRIDPADIPAQSIVNVTAADIERAREQGHVIRQIARADRSSASVDVGEVPRDSIFGRTIGAGNAAIITGRYAGAIELSGAGAGGDATAVAILSDLVAISSDFRLPTSHFHLAEAV